MALFGAYSSYPQVSGSAGATFGSFGTSGVPQTGLPVGYSLSPMAASAATPYTGGLAASAACGYGSAPAAPTMPVAWNTLASKWARPGYQ